MSYRLAISLVTGAGLLACVVFVAGYWTVTRGGWLREEAGRFLMSLSTLLGVLFTYVLLGQARSDDVVEWSPRRIFALVVYAAFVAVMWWPLRLLWVAQRVQRR